MEIGKCYIDSRGWKFCVRSGIGENEYKGFYQKPEHFGGVGWHGVRSLPWVRDIETAQRDLDDYAARKHMERWDK